MAVVKFLGQSAFEITTSDSKRIYLDPWLDSNPVSPIKVKDIQGADVVCVTHGHSDHLGDAIEIVRQTGATLVCSPEIGFYAEKFGIIYDQGSFPLHVGGSAEVRGITIHATNAVHGSEVYGPDWVRGNPAYPGAGCLGFVIEVERGVRVYHAGDTALFGDMCLIAELYQPTIALLPIGGRYTMDCEQAALAAQLLKPEVVVPMHYNTFENEQRADPAEFARLVAEKAPQARVVILQPGETYECSPAAVST